MIQLTRLNNQPLMVNADLIKFVEQAPDTVITLVTGDKLVVRESAQEVMDLILEFRRSLMAAPVVPKCSPTVSAQAQNAKDDGE